jgi:hypothetical protein
MKFPLGLLSSRALCSLYVPLLPLRPSALFTALYRSTALYPSKTLYPLYGPLSALRPSVTPVAFCLLHGPLYCLRLSAPLSQTSISLRPSTPSTADLCHLYGLLSHLRPSVPFRSLSPLWHSFHSAALSPLYGPLSFLRPSVSSMAFYPLYGPLSTIQQSASSMALCPLYGSLPLYGALPLLQPSVSSTARRLLYGLLSPLREMFFLSVSRNDDFFSLFP